MSFHSTSSEETITFHDRKSASFYRKCSEDSPLTEELRRVEWPKHFKMPSHIHKFTGAEDPKEFLYSYLMAFQFAVAATSQILANCFRDALSGPAQQWYENLRAGSIGSWTEFQDIFCVAFWANYTRLPDPSRLFSRSLRRKQGETLQHYKDRFFAVAQLVVGANEMLQIHAFRNGLPIGSDLRRDLVRESPTDISQLMDIVHGFIRIETARDGPGEEGRRYPEEDQFQANVQVNYTRPHDVSELLRPSLGQKEGETLRDYMKRFCAVACHFIRSNFRVTAGALENGVLRGSGVYLELVMEQPTSAKQLFDIVKGFINVEEDEAEARRDLEEEEEERRRRPCQRYRRRRKRKRGVDDRA